jgi:hypothetical protein
MISSGEIITNYNNGIGMNPAETENLLLWYKFEKFELLDFSPQQDGSILEIGIRDYSLKNNHGLPVGLITDPTASGDPIQPF